MRKLPLLLAVAWCGLASADPPKPVLEFPVLAEPQVPRPMPTVGSPIVLPTNKTLVVQSATEWIVHPPNSTVLDVQFVKGPTSITSNFVENSTNRLTTRTFDKANIYVITVAEGVTDGTQEVMFIPVGVKAWADIKFQTVQVGKGKTPDVKPPPDVKPVVPPKVVPIPDAGFHVLVVYESSEVQTYPEGVRAVLTSQDVRKYLFAKNAVARFADKDATDLPDPLQKAMARERKTKEGQPGRLPWIIIAKDGKDGTEEALPASIPEALTLLKKYGGN